MPTTLLGAFLLIVVAAAPDARGQSVRYDHVHLAVTDAPKAAQWYIAHLGLKPYDRPDRIISGTITFSFLQSPAPKPSRGSVIDHIGFSFPNLEAKLTELEAAGAKIVTPPRDAPGLFKLAFVEDPWGTTLEILQDPELLGFHHIHLRVANPEATLQWYLEMFGGERSKLKGRLDAIRYTDPDVWLLAQRGEGVTPSGGHTIDHISWRLTDLDAKVAAMKTKNAKVTTEPRDVERPKEYLRVALIEDPSGVKIELTRRIPK